MRQALQRAYDHVPHYRTTALPHYRKVFNAKGVHPLDCKTLADLALFPFTAKSDLRANYPFGVFAVPRDRVVRVQASSGTTGKPTVVGCTQQDTDTWVDLMHAASGLLVAV